MKYIGIVSRVLKTDYDKYVNGVGESYRKALLKYDDIYPILIFPPKDIFYGDTSSSKELREDYNLNSKLDSLLDLCDGFLVPGGNKWFSYDEYVIQYALDNDKPILGICLGMQLMATVDNKINRGKYVGNKLINTDISHIQAGVNYVHEISVLDNTILKSILGVNKCFVNSRHNYSIYDVVNFRISAYSSDGVIEAIEHPDKKFALGVQWHPEDMIEYDSNMKKIFDRFVEKVVNDEKI